MEQKTYSQQVFKEGSVTGTRGAVGFHKGGVDKITYNHYDSYPSVLGNAVKDFLVGTSKEKIEEIFNKIVMVDEDAPVTDEDRELCKEFTNKNVSTGDDWYSLLRNAQGNLAAYRDTDLKFMIESKDFMKESLFCEWAYIYNLDTGTLEIYRGLQASPQENRYKTENSNHGHYNVALILEEEYEDLNDFDMDQLEDMVNGEDE